MGEQEINEPSLEKKTYPPVEVTYKGDTDPDSRLLAVDGSILAQAIQESDYPPSVIKPVVIDDGKGMHGELAHNNLLGGKIVLNEEGLISQLREVREKEHQRLEGLEPSKLKRFLKTAKKLVNPISAPYVLLKDQGTRPYYVGDEKRHRRYIEAAKAGFVRTENGQVTQMSPEDSIEHAKQFLDGLLEQASPRLIGMILAHEYEHGHKKGAKMAVKLGSLVLPVAVGAVASKLSLPPEELGQGIVASAPFGYVGSIIGRMLDERASYHAGDRNMYQFGKAVTINHEVFQNKVLGVPSDNTQQLE